MSAQSFRGSISGTVTDATGAVVPQAHVTLKSAGAGLSREATTNAEGVYALPDLPPGTYTLTVSAAGFKEARSSDIILTAQQNTRFDATLEVGAISESVQVRATAPAFAVPPNGRFFGNSARNVIVGPGLANVDFGLFKYFHVTERAKFQVRMTATNFFNHPNLGNPNANVTVARSGGSHRCKAVSWTLLAAERGPSSSARFDF